MSNVAFNLKTFENRAKFSVVLAVVGVMLAAASAVFMIQRFKPAVNEIVLSSRGFSIIAAMIALAILLGIIGSLMGLNGAGEKRNKATQLSWLGFFLNSGAVAVSLSLLVVFMFLRHVI